MCATLGGRAAEDLFLNRISTGAMNDLERVTKQAYGMIAYLGMSDKLPNLCYYNNEEYSFNRPYSEKTAELIDTEVKNMVNELTELHYYLLHESQDMKYKQLFMMTANNLLDYRRKTNLPEEVSDVELALHALYGHLMLRLQKKEINSQTTMAMETFSRMLAYLALRYKEVEENEEMM